MGLAAKNREGRFSRHAVLNGIIHRALAPSCLEPSGVFHSDEITVVPQKCGILLVKRINGISVLIA